MFQNHWIWVYPDVPNVQRKPKGNTSPDIWWFPKIGGPPNHPYFSGIFPYKPSIWGTPIYGNTHMVLQLVLSLLVNDLEDFTTIPVSNQTEQTSSPKQELVGDS